MARRASPYRVYARGGTAWIDVRSIPGFPRLRESLDVAYGDWARRKPTREASEAAAERYRRFVAGRVSAPTDRVLTAATDEELFALWLDAIETPRNKKSVDVKGTYSRTWHAFFCDESKRDDGEPRWKDKRTALERMVADAGPEDFALHRLTKILRKTVRKELTAMFEFFRWAKLRGHIAVIPPRPELPKGQPGVRASKQRAKPVHVTQDQARKIIDELPEWSRSADKANHQHRAFRVRDPFDFMWETALRPSTIARLSVPENWTRGSKVVTLHDADDKAMYGRDVPITERACEILDRCAPKAGVIFGSHDARKYIKAAALKVLPPESARQFARYDFRHGRINNLLETAGNDLLGVAYLAGHKQLTTTNAYLQAQQRQGAAVIAAADRVAKVGATTDDGAEVQGTDGARALNSDDDPTVFQSGRVDSNHRPPDPQNSGAQKGRENGPGSSDGEPPSAANLRSRSRTSDRIGARSGHDFVRQPPDVQAYVAPLIGRALAAALRGEPEGTLAPLAKAAKAIDRGRAPKRKSSVGRSR